MKTRAPILAIPAADSRGVAARARRATVQPGAGLFVLTLLALGLVQLAARV